MFSATFSLSVLLSSLKIAASVFFIFWGMGGSYHKKKIASTTFLHSQHFIFKIQAIIQQNLTFSTCTKLPHNFCNHEIFLLGLPPSMLSQFCIVHGSGIARFCLHCNIHHFLHKLGFHGLHHSTRHRRSSGLDHYFVSLSLRMLCPNSYLDAFRCSDFI